MILYTRIKAFTQEKLAERAADVATEIESKGGTIVSITLYADSSSWGRNKAGVVFYRASRQVVGEDE